MPSNVTNQDALAWFKAKGLKPSFDFRDVWKEEHNNAFTVAKMLNLDLLEDVQLMVSSAIENGQTFAQFRDTLKPHLVKKGWWGIQEMVDPLTLDAKPVQLGSTRRIKTIYKTNMRTARAAGQWERAQRTKRALPYLLYELGPSEHHRHEHEKWAGTCLPIDHAFWQTHFVPNGWGCKCGIRQVSEREYQALLKAGKIKTQAPDEKTKQYLNKRTGEVENVPVGIDPGWNYNPGSRLAKLASNTMSKAIDADPMTASITITDLMKVKAISGEVGKVFSQGVEDAVKQIAAGKAIPRGTTWHLGAISPEVVTALKNENVLLNSSVISIQDGDLFHMLRGQKATRLSQGKVVDKRLPISFLQQLPAQLLTPKAIVRDLQQKTPTLLYVYQTEENGKKVTLKLNYEIKVNKEKVKTNLIRSGEIVDDINTLKASKVYQLIWGEL